MNIKSADIYLNTLCLASYAPGPTSKKFVDAVIKMYEEAATEDKTLINPVNNLYVKILKDVSSGELELSNKGEIAGLMLRLADDPIMKSDPGRVQDLQQLLTNTEPVSDARIRSLVKKIRNQLIWTKSNRKLRRMLGISQQAASTPDVERQDLILNELLESAKELQSNMQEADMDDAIQAPINEIDLTNPQTILKAVTAQKKKRSERGIKFGLQGFNRLFGPRQEAAYGEFLAICARSHHYKSGILMDIARWICTLNDPPDTGGLTPIVLFISLENEIYENLMQWFQSAYVNAFKKDPEGLKDEEIVEYVSRTYSKRGFKLIVLRRMGEAFGYKEFVEEVEKQEKLGGKVVATVLDYITLCKRCPEDKAMNDAKQIQLMGERFHNYVNHHDMFFATGLQMDTEAGRLAASGQTNIVKRYGEAHLADCKGLKREFDCMFFQEIENNHRGIPYLTWAWNKHRYVNDTPSEWKYTAYRFGKLGILDDINGEDMSVSDIYADDRPEDDDAKQAPCRVNDNLF